MKRHRPTYAFLTALVILLGLASRSAGAAALPAFVGNYSGDTLWALMVFLILGFLFPQRPTAIVALLALAFSFSIEASQWYRGDWLNQIRATRIGALILGSGFLWSDLACYLTGIAIGIAGESLLRSSKNKSS